MVGWQFDCFFKEEFWTILRWLLPAWNHCNNELLLLSIKILKPAKRAVQCILNDKVGYTMALKHFKHIFGHKSHSIWQSTQVFQIIQTLISGFSMLKLIRVNNQCFVWKMVIKQNSANQPTVASSKTFWRSIIVHRGEQSPTWRKKVPPKVPFSHQKWHYFSPRKTFSSD